MPAIIESIINQLFQQKDQVEAWFDQQIKQCCVPFYCSVDLRYSGFKAAVVDTNLFPAGFNNLNEQARSDASQIIADNLVKYYQSPHRVLLVPENHTRNLMYLENVFVLQSILQQAGCDVRVGSLLEDFGDDAMRHDMTLPSRNILRLHGMRREGARLFVDDFDPELIVLNHDLSDVVPDILQDLEQPLTPSLHLGWSNRLKSIHFGYNRQFAERFADQFDLDPWLLNSLSDHCDSLDFLHQVGFEELAARVDAMLKQIHQCYQSYQIEEKPFVVIKSDNGTYGMAVTMVTDASQVLALNRKKRTKMSSGKNGQQVARVLIQEGVASIDRVFNNHTAEPVIYMAGSQVIGGFYRAHEKKGRYDSLNASGMTFQSISQDELSTPRGYFNQILSRLALLAAGKEICQVCPTTLGV